MSEVVNTTYHQQHLAKFTKARLPGQFLPKPHPSTADVDKSFTARARIQDELIHGCG